MVAIAADRVSQELPTLLDRVAGGEEITITRNGEAVARLVALDPVPIEQSPGPSRADVVEEAIEWFRQLREKQPKGDQSVVDMVREGRQR